MRHPVGGTVTKDAFGNPLDASVGYARGRYLRDSAAEVRRQRHAQALAARTAPADIAIFTGNPRYFPLRPEDLDIWCEEWVGPGHFAQELTQAAIEHMGGGTTAAVVNRTSAGIVAAVLALAQNRPVVSLVPEGDRSHASLVRGAQLAGVALVEVHTLDAVTTALRQHAPALFVVTPVTSALGRVPDALTRAAVAAAKGTGAVTFLDEAYGARLRPCLHGGAPSLQLGADFAITNADKAGLSGPRAGIFCGTERLVIASLAKASELGMEARAPIAAGALRSLQRYDPADLLAEARDGAAISQALATRWGATIVQRSDLGPMVSEDHCFARVLASAGRTAAPLVPAEVTALIGLRLLDWLGVLTVNTHGAPGGRVSLRLKPVAGALARVGGAESLVDGIDAAIAEVATHLDDPSWIETTLFGARG